MLTQDQLNRLNIFQSTKLPTLLALFSVVLFLLFAGYQIELPGIYYDEVLQMPAAIDLLKGPVNGTYHKFGSQEIFGKTFTLMNLDYIGAVKCYLLAVTMGVFGIDVKVMRYSVLAIFVLGLVVFWHFTKEEYGEKVAAIVAILVATDPGMVMLSRVDNGPIVIAFAARSLTLWMAARWWRSGGRARYLIATGVFAGLGFYDKANFLWFILALSFTGFIAYLLDKRRPSISLLTNLWTLMAGVLGSLPFWIYNFHYEWPFLKKINHEMTINDYITQAPQRTKMLAGLVNGDGPSWLYFSANDVEMFPVGKGLYLPLFLSALLVVLLVAIARQHWRLIFLPGIIGLIALQIFITPNRIGLHHWTMIHPIPHLIVGIAIQIIWSQLTQVRQMRRRVVLAVLSSLILMVVIVNCRVILRYHQLLDRSGGSGLFSAAIYNLSETLMEAYPDRSLQLMDWGLNHTLFFLSSGKLNTNEPFWDMVDGKNTDKLMLQLLENRQHVFVFNAPSEALYPEVYYKFHQMIDANGWRKARDIRIYDRRSIWNYSIIEVEKLKSSLDP